jgi:hypothetical protein
MARDLSLQNNSKLQGKIDALLLRDLSEFEEGRPLSFDVHRLAAHPLSRHASFLSVQPVSCGRTPSPPASYISFPALPLVTLCTSKPTRPHLDLSATAFFLLLADCSFMSRRYAFPASLDMEDEEMPGPEVSPSLR